MLAREAMAHGRTVVASRVGGLVDAIEDGRTGLLVEPADPVALRAALVRALDDGELRERLGAAARAQVVERLGWEAWSAATVAALRHAAGNRAASRRRT